MAGLALLGAPPAPGPALAQGAADFFVEEASAAGLVFRHTGTLYFEGDLLDSYGGGACWGDYDRDGWPDVFVPNQAYRDAALQASLKPRGQLFHHLGRAPAGSPAAVSFEDATSTAGVEREGHGLGCVFGDYDNDGWPDLLVSGYEHTILYRNLGDGTFVDATEAAGVLGAPRFASSAAWADVDRDGWLDLYVLGYSNYTLDKGPSNFPPLFAPIANALYHNLGDGTFAEVAASAGAADAGHRGIALGFADYDLDGWDDVYVGNDVGTDTLLRNLGPGPAFGDVSVAANVADPRPGMGVAWNDYDGDGLPDAVVTYYKGQHNALHRNLGDGAFQDVAEQAGFQEDLAYVGWGVVFNDLDLDGWPDLFVANGHTDPFLPDWPQPNQLLLNNGDATFREAGPTAGAALQLRKVSRGAAAADYDLDGDLDLLVVNNGNDTADLLNNRNAGRGQHWLEVELVGTDSNRDAVGAVVQVTPAAGRRQWGQVAGGGSLLSGHAPAQVFGLGGAASADVLVRWPSGRVQELRGLPADQWVRITEGHESYGTDPFPPETLAEPDAAPGPDGTYPAGTRVALRAEDRGLGAPSGVAATSFSLDSGPWARYGAPVSLCPNGCTAGTHELRFRSEDRAGNVEAVGVALFDVAAGDSDARAELKGQAGRHSWFQGPVTVALALGAGAGPSDTLVVTIDDGAEATYAGSFGVAAEGAHVLRYARVAPDGQRGTEHTLAFGIDTAKPTARHAVVGSQGATGWWRGPLRVTLAGSDATSGVERLVAAVDGAHREVGRDGLVKLREGAHTLRYHAEDRAGLAGNATSLAFGVDETPPATSASLAGEKGLAGWWRSGVNATLAASDALSGVDGVWSALDGGAFARRAALEITGDAEHTLAFYATDLAGNREAVQELRVAIDHTPPATQAQANGTEGAHSWLLPPVEVRLTAADAASGVASLWLGVDGADLQEGNATTLDSDGIHHVAYHAEDRAGNVEAGRSLRVSIDGTPPTTTAGLAGTTGDAGWWRSGVAVALEAQDAASGVAATSFALDGGTWRQGASLQVAGDGEHTLRFRSEDVAGNQEPEVVLSVPVDATPPSTAALPNGTRGLAGWWRSSVALALEAQDAASGVAATRHALDGGPWADGARLDVAGDGSHEVAFFSRDAAGNEEAPRSLAVPIDGTPPATRAVPSGLPGLAGWWRSPVNVTLDARDATSGVEHVWSALDHGAPARRGQVLVEGDGTHRLAYHAVDRAGNQEPPRALDVRVDATPPTTEASLTGTSGNAGWWRSRVAVTLEAEDAASGVAATRHALDGGAWRQGARLEAAGDGEHDLRFRSEDAAGNEEPERSLALRIDATPPRTRALLEGTQGNDGWWRSSVEVSLEAEDATSGVAASSHRADGGAPGQGTAFRVEGDGAHTVDFWTTDAAGNEEAPHHVALRIDATPPSLALLQPTQGGAYVAGHTLPLPAPLPLTLAAGELTVRAAAEDDTSGVERVELWVDGILRGVVQVAPYEFLWRASDEALGNHTLEARAFDRAGNAAAQGLGVHTVPGSPAGAMATLAQACRLAAPSLPPPAQPFACPAQVAAASGAAPVRPHGAGPRRGALPGAGHARPHDGHHGGAA